VRRHRIASARAIAVVVLCLLSACASDPATELVQQREALTAFQDSVLILHESKTIDDETASALATGSLAAAGYLDAARAQIADDGSPTPEFEMWLERARAALAELYTIEAQRNTIMREVER